jgi:ParB/RepB/Spo0J family partition protein
MTTPKPKPKPKSATKIHPENPKLLRLAAGAGAGMGVGVKREKAERDAKAKRDARAAKAAVKLEARQAAVKLASEAPIGLGFDGEPVNVMSDDMARSLPSRTIRFDQIVIDKDFNSRKDYRGISTLAEDIDENGLISPPLVSQDPKNPERFFLIAGFRRTLAISMLREAARKAGATELPYDQIEVKVHSGPEIGRWILNLRENMSRVDLHVWEIGDQCVKIRERFQLSGAQIGEKLSYQKSHVNNCIRVVERIVADVQKQFREGNAEPPFSLLTTLASLNLADGSPDHDRQRIKWSEWLGNKGGKGGSEAGAGDGNEDGDEESPSGKMRRLRECEKLLAKIEDGLKEATRETDREYFRGAIGVTKWIMGLTKKIKRVSFAASAK